MRAAFTARWRFAALVLLALLGAAACRGKTVDRAVLDARTLSCARPEDPGLPLRATLYPASHRAASARVPIVILEPLLFRREILDHGGDGGLLAHFGYEGIPVWVVWVDGKLPPDARALGAGFAYAVESIARESGARTVDVMGLSISAPAVLYALERLAAARREVTVRKTVLLGAGLDYAYPSSFGARVADVRGGPAKAACALDAVAGCARYFRDAPRAVPWLGVIPPAEPGELRAARERFPFVAHFRDRPVLFVAGKGDGIAPSESMYPVYESWGSDEADARAVPKLLFLAGRENGLGEDYDHLALFAGPHAEDEVWSYVTTWLERP